MRLNKWINMTKAKEHYVDMLSYLIKQRWVDYDTYKELIEERANLLFMNDVANESVDNLLGCELKK